MMFTSEETAEGRERIKDFPVVKRLAEIAPSWLNALHFPYDIGVEISGEPPSRIGFRSILENGKTVRATSDFPPADATDDDLRVFMMEHLGRLAEKIKIDELVDTLFGDSKDGLDLAKLAGLLKGRKR